MKKQNILLLMMAGKGTRFGEKIPKQFYLIDEIPLFVYILKKICKVECIDKVVIITNPDYLSYTSDFVEPLKNEKIYKIISGGNGRSQDILAGLEAIKEIANNDDAILMYDATHPFVDTDGIKKVCDAIHQYGAATLAAFQYDTTYLIDDKSQEVVDVIPRQKLIAGASPEGFRFKEIYNVYLNTKVENLNLLTSAGAIALANNIKMVAIETKILNLKITFYDDIKIVEQLLKMYLK